MRYLKCAKCQNYVPNVMTATCCDCDGICNYEEKQLTRADRIRAMSDEELAEFLEEMTYDSIENRARYWLGWLKWPVEDGEI